MIQAYFTASYRGNDGNWATEATVAENKIRAVAIATKIHEAFPCIDLFVPHLQEDLEDKRNPDGLIINSESVLEKCFEKVQKIAESGGLLIVLRPWSEGMCSELNVFANAGGEYIVEIDEWSDGAREKIANSISEMPMPESSES